MGGAVVRRALKGVSETVPSIRSLQHPEIVVGGCVNGVGLVAVVGQCTLNDAVEEIFRNTQLRQADGQPDGRRHLLDGRADIHWSQSLTFRLTEKAVQLDRYAAQLESISGSQKIGPIAKLTQRLKTASTGHSVHVPQRPDGCRSM